MTKTPRILVVEDDPLIAWDIASELADRGYEVVGPAGRVAAALDLVAHEDLSIAVLDINLGAGTSFEIARALDRKQVPYIFLSGDPEKRPDEFSHRCVLTKPIDFSVLDETLKVQLR